MTDKCIICLEELRDNIGVITPCGHCFHRDCFKALKNKEIDTDQSNDENSNKLPRCPVCKHKSKKFVDIYLTFESRDGSNCTDCSSEVEGSSNSPCSDETKALASLTSENMRLRKTLQETKSISKGQGELLLDVLPKFDDLQSKLTQMTKDKEKIEKELREVEEENSELLTGWNDIEIKMQMVKIERDELEDRLRETKKTNTLLNTKWNELDQKLVKAKKKRKLMESKQANELEDVKCQMTKSQREKQELIDLLKKAHAKNSNLKRTVKRLKKKYSKNGIVPKDKRKVK